MGRLLHRLAERLSGAVALLLLVLHAAAFAQAGVGYAGVLPCADCDGRQIVLTLFDDQSFRMRTTYLGVKPGREAVFHDLGRWSRQADGTLLLRSGTELLLRFSPAPGGGLRQLDQQGRRIESRFDHELQRLDAPDRIAGPMRLRGMLRYFADAATLDECRSGRRWPVMIEADFLALERAYQAQRALGSGEWLLATLQARFEPREPEPGLPPREVLVVERFERLWPRETCAEDAPATAALLNTRWRLVAVDGRAVQLEERQREPFLQLSLHGNRVSGFGGCNPFSGRFEQRDEALRLQSLASGPRRACGAEAAAQEAAYLAALRDTTALRIVGDTLRLSDAQGRLRLRFEALYLR
jgi:copper homeostasis protein (lipoprotein)